MGNVSEEEIKTGVVKLQNLVNEYVSSNQSTGQVREYLSKVLNDEELLEGFLRCRKFNVDSAFEKLKGGTELRFNVYPEIYHDAIPQLGYNFQTRGIIGILKVRDNLGRRVVFVDGASWDPNEFGLNEIIGIGAVFMDLVLRDRDAVNNGIIVVQNCDQMGLAHAKYFTISALRKSINIFLRTGAVKVKGLHFPNLPNFLVYIPELLKPFLPRKVKERVHVYGQSKGYEEFHKFIDPSQLPKFLGGPLDITEASDEKFYKL